MREVGGFHTICIGNPQMICGVTLRFYKKLTKRSDIKKEVCAHFRVDGCYNKYRKNPQYII